MEKRKPKKSVDVNDTSNVWWKDSKTNVSESLNQVFKLNLIPTVWSDAYESHVVRRHIWGLNPWSKALPEAPDQLFIDILNRVDREYQKLIDSEWNPGRRLFAAESKEPIWTNALFPKENLTQESVFLSHRDIWNERINNWEGQEILCSLIWSDDMPTTNLVHVIMWPYGPTGKAGIYTMIFWDEWMPFPRNLDGAATEKDIEYNEKCREYWDNHVMLVTPKEIEKIVELKKEHGMSAEVEEKALRDFEEKNKKSPIQKDFIPKISDWTIKIDLNGN